MGTTLPDDSAPVSDLLRTVPTIRTSRSAPGRGRIAGAVLLLGSLLVLGSLALPWLSAVTIVLPYESGSATYDFTWHWHLWNTGAVIGVLFALDPLVVLLPVGLRGVRGAPIALRRRTVLLMALGGIVGTIIFLLLLAIAGAPQACRCGDPDHPHTELYLELGVGICLAGYGLAVVGAALLPPALTPRGTAHSTPVGPATVTRHPAEA